MRSIVLAAICALSIPHASLAADATPKDYAYGIEIATSGDGALFDLSLEDDVYKRVTQGNLQDICVFNGEEEMVPFWLQWSGDIKTVAPRTVELPIFPLYQDSGKERDDLYMQFRKDQDGSIVTLRSGVDSLPDEKLYAFMVDGSAVKQPITALEIEWEQPGGKNLFMIDVDSSSDLKIWRSVVRGAVIANMDYAGHNLEQREIKLEGAHAKYLRLLRRDSGKMVKLSKVTAVLQSSSVQIQRRWTLAEGARDRKQKEQYFIDLDGYYPVDRLRVKLPQRNTIATAMIFSRQSESAPWILRQTAVIYRLEDDGATLTNPDIQFPATSAKQWMMRIEKEGGGLGQELPSFEFGWLPHAITFSARGNPPFTLAFASALNPSCSGKTTNLLDKLQKEQRDETSVKKAAIGRLFTLGGDAALRPQASGYDWKVIILWAILILGVCALGWMSYSLYRQMNSDNGGKPEQPE